MMKRKEILEAAIAHTCGERNVEYGSPVRNLGDCAELWTAYLAGKTSGCSIGATGGAPIGGQYELTAEDVAWLNVLQKIARTFNGKASADTYEDAAAYAAIAGECSHD